LGNERELCQIGLLELRPILSKGDILTQRLNKIRQIAVNKRQLLGAAKQNLAALDTLEQRGAVYQDKRIELVRHVGLYTELRDAFGVNGIPAMIIEHTLPELEREANRILQQLTGGRMHVRFETQRETKTGTLRETLDIIISDEKGTRPYENFSGGEQFRVNFAIRVALSRLLARRSGVRLRSLFVDEGFGSLDADGRQRLVEAVMKVQDSFHLIMVITHIDELREAFPTQILVSKSDAGSVVEVV
jgi:exonuclease SbcC